MMSSEAEWRAGTFEGARRAQLRRALALTVRERLEALEALADASERLARLRDASTSAPSGPGRARNPRPGGGG